MDYEPLLKLPTGTEDIDSVFKTMRPNDPNYPGSAYAHHADNSTTGYRAPSDMPDTPHEVQGRSYKTLYLEPRAVNSAAGWFRDENISTYAIPETDDKGKSTGKLLIKSAEDQKVNDKINYKKDQVLTRVDYSPKPQVGLSPVEFGPTAASPKGSKGDAHWGNAITEVHPKPARLMQNLPMRGGYTPGVDNLQHSLNPLKLKKGGMIDRPLVGGNKLI
jgi:hypothetical protein